jgi:hypothetical protein
MVEQVESFLYNLCMAEIEWWGGAPEEFIREIKDAVRQHRESKYSFQVGIRDLEFTIDEARAKALGVTLPWLIDRLAIELCEYVRGKRCPASPLRSRKNVINGLVSFPARGRRSVGPRLHFTTTLGGIVDSWLLAPGALHDLTPTPELLPAYRDKLAIGDRAYNRDIIGGTAVQIGIHVGWQFRYRRVLQQRQNWRCARCLKQRCKSEKMRHTAGTRIVNRASPYQPQAISLAG